MTSREGRGLAGAVGLGLLMVACCAGPGLRQRELAADVDEFWQRLAIDGHWNVDEFDSAQGLCRPRGGLLRFACPGLFKPCL